MTSYVTNPKTFCVICPGESAKVAKLPFHRHLVALKKLKSKLFFLHLIIAFLK